MKLNLPSEDTLLSLSAIGSGALAAQFALAPRTTHEFYYSAEKVPWHASNEVPWQWAGLALAGHAAKDMAVSVRSTKTKSEAKDACKIAGLSWLASSGYSLATTLQNKQKDDVGFASAAVMGVLAATLLAKGYGLDEEDNLLKVS